MRDVQCLRNSRGVHSVCTRPIRRSHMLLETRFGGERGVPLRDRIVKYSAPNLERNEHTDHTFLSSVGSFLSAQFVKMANLCTPRGSVNGRSKAPLWRFMTPQVRRQVT